MRFVGTTACPPLRFLLTLGLCGLVPSPAAAADAPGAPRWEGVPAGAPTLRSSGEASRALPFVVPMAPVPDTFGDPHVRRLLERGREARSRGAEGLASYQGRVWERIYLGLDAGAFRRERGLIQEERSALVRWSAEGERRVLWEGARRDIPIAGLSSARDEGLAASLARELGRSRLPPPLTFDPGSDRIFFGPSDWALNPLADTAGLHYRFHSGDTLRITLPEDGRQVVLAEIRVEPRRSEFRLLAASLWFDTTSGALVRGVYRPARPFDLAMDGDPDDRDDVPRLLRPIRAEIRVVSVDHGYFDFRWWIPRRFLFEGEASVGRVARFPLRVEWTLDDVEVNAAVPPELSGEDRPEGWNVTTTWVARASRGDSVPVTLIVPPAADLATGSGVSDALIPARPSVSESELRELESRLSSLLPVPAGAGVDWLWGLEESLLRYNRVEGLAAGLGARGRLPGGLELQGRVRSGVSARRPTADLVLRGGTPGRRWEAAVFRDLRGASEWHDPGSLSASLGNLVNGEGPAPWYRAWGASVGAERHSGGHRWGATLFAERQGTAEFGTSDHLRRLLDGERILSPNIEAREGGWAGIRGDHRWQSGVDPSGIRLFTQARGEAAGGESGYGRGSLRAAAVIPLVPGWEGALEVGGGGAVGDLPRQRRFFPGGPSGFRGGLVGEREGEGYWLARAEVGRGFTGARAVVFLDALRMLRASGPDTGFAEGGGSLEPGDGGGGHLRHPDLAAGVGVSLLDGLLRMDVARKVRPEGGWRLHFYLDGLF
jgi:hypothetical protein